MGRTVVRITSQCDNQCLFCARQGLPNEEPPSLGAVLSEARQTSDELMLVGGEPGLVPESRLVETLAQARALGFRRIGLQSNGRRLAEAGLAGRLAKAGLTDVHLSLHGAEAAVHDYHVGVRGAFVQGLAAIGTVRAAGLTVAVSTVLTRSNYRVLKPMPRLLSSSGVSAWNVLLPRTAGALGAVFDRVMPRLAMALPFALHAVDAAGRLGLPAFLQGAPACLLGPLANRALEGDVRTHAPACQSCPSRSHCPGLDEGYLARFKGDELIARDTARPGSDHPALRAMFVGVGELAPSAAVGGQLPPNEPLVALGRR